MTYSSIISISQFIIKFARRQSSFPIMASDNETAHMADKRKGREEYGGCRCGPAEFHSAEKNRNSGKTDSFSKFEYLKLKTLKVKQRMVISRVQPRRYWSCSLQSACHTWSSAPTSTSGLMRIWTSWAWRIARTNWFKCITVKTRKAARTTTKSYSMTSKMRW